MFTRSWEAEGMVHFVSPREKQRHAVEEKVSSSREEKKKKKKPEMDAEMLAATRLLTNMISKRGEKMKESEVEQLALWARKKGKLSKSSLVFCEIKWREIGDLLWRSAIAGGKEGKIAQELGAVWQKISTTLETLAAERKVAEAAILALETSTPADLANMQKSSKVARFFGINSAHPVRRNTAPFCSCLQDVVNSVENRADSLQEVSLAVSRENGGNQEARQPSDSGGVVKDETAGRSEGGVGLAQETTQGGDEKGGDETRTERLSPVPEDKAVMQAQAVHVAKTNMAPPMPASVAASSATAADPGATAWLAKMTHQPVAALCPLPSDSDPDSDSDHDSSSPDLHSASWQKKKPPYAQELRQTVEGLAKLSTRLSSKEDRMALSVTRQNPITNEWSKTLKDAMRDGNFDIANHAPAH